MKQCIAVILSCLLFGGCVTTTYVFHPGQYAEINEQGMNYHGLVSVGTDSTITEHKVDALVIERDSVRWVNSEEWTAGSAPISHLLRIRFIKHTLGALEGLGVGAGIGGLFLLIEPREDFHLKNFHPLYKATSIFTALGYFVLVWSTGHKTDYVFLHTNRSDFITTDKRGSIICDAVIENPLYLEYAPYEFRDNNALVIRAAEQNPLAMQFASSRLREDKETIRMILSGNGLALQYVVASLRSDTTCVSTAVQQNGLALQHASDGLRDAPNIVRTAVTRNGLALQYASGGLRDDMEIVLTAVTQNGLALQYASQRLRDVKEVVLKAVQRNGRAIQYASDGMKEDREVVLSALTQNITAIEFIPEKMKNDPGIRQFLERLLERKRNADSLLKSVR